MFFGWGEENYPTCTLFWIVVNSSRGPHHTTPPSGPNCGYALNDMPLDR